MNRPAACLLAMIVASSLALIGCAPTVQSGAFKVYKDTFDGGVTSIKSQVAFATSCPADQVQVVVLATDPYDTPLPTTMGATACGKKLVYARVPGTENWILNSDSESAGGKQGK